MVNYTGRGLVVKRPGVLSKVQLLTLILGVGVFSLLPINLGVWADRVENTPTCYRAPKWPDLEFPRKIPKKYPPGPKFWTPRIYPQNTPKIPKKYPQNIPKMRILGISSVFLGYFLGVPESRPEGYFFGIFCGNSGSGHLGAL